MAAPTTIEDALLQTALNPRSVATDKGRVESHSIRDLLSALNHEAASDAAPKNHLGFTFIRLESPGAG